MVFTMEPILWLEAGGGGRFMGAKTSVYIEFAKIREFAVMVGVLVRRSWVNGSKKRMWKSSLKIQTVEAWIVGHG